MPDRKRINFVIPPAKKERWDAYIDEHPEYDSMADFVRTSVAHEMAGRTDGGQTDELSMQLAEVVDGIDELSDRMVNIETRLRTLENQSTRDPQVDRITGNLYAQLPTSRPGTGEWQQEMDNRENQLEAAQYGEEPKEGAKKAVEAWKGTVDGLATSLDEPTHIVRKALEKLLSDTHRIRKTDDGRYYRND